MAEPVITLEDIDKIAELASLELSPEEKARFVQQFAGILAYFRKIDAVELPPGLAERGPETAAPLRKDAAAPSGITPAEFSPHLEQGYFKVPKVIE